MELVDPQGNKIKTSKSKEQVMDILKTLKPMNKEQEMILARAIGKQMEKARKNKMTKELKQGFDGVFQRNAMLRAKTDGFSESRDWRLEAIIPKEMFYVARKIWGDDVITNPAKFKEAFVKDEQGRLCLTVDPSTI